jgi:hypothetical protein
MSSHLQVKRVVNMEGFQTSNPHTETAPSKSSRARMRRSLIASDADKLRASCMSVLGSCLACRNNLCHRATKLNRLQSSPCPFRGFLCLSGIGLPRRPALWHNPSPQHSTSCSGVSEISPSSHRIKNIHQGLSGSLRCSALQRS